LQWNPLFRPTSTSGTSSQYSLSSCKSTVCSYPTRTAHVPYSTRSTALQCSTHQPSHHTQIQARSPETRNPKYRKMSSSDH
jgi:hypothetical protein